MRNRFTAFAVLCGLLFGGSAHANSFVFSRSQIVAELPVNWQIDNQGDNVTFSTKDKNVAISLAWGGKDLNEAWRILTTEVGKVVSGVKVERKPGKTGTFTGFNGTGRGKLGTTEVQCYLSAVTTPGGAMTVFLLHPIGKEKPHQAAITQFMDSLAPAEVKNAAKKK